MCYIMFQAEVPNLRSKFDAEAMQSIRSMGGLIIAEVAELADAAASKAVDRKIMRVRLPPSALNLRMQI